MPLSLQPHLVTSCSWWDIHSSMVLTPLWSVGNCVTSSWFICINIVFTTCLYNEMCFNALLRLITPIVAHFLHLCARFTYSSVYTSSFHTLLAHHHLCYVDVYIVYLVQHCVLVILFSLLYYVFWACPSHWLNWSHEYFVRYVIFGPTFFSSIFIICYLWLWLHLHAFTVNCLIVSFGLICFFCFVASFSLI